MTKKLFFAVTLFCALAKLGWSADIVITVNKGGSPVADVACFAVFNSTVASSNFGPGGPDATLSQVGLTGVDGKCTFTNIAVGPAQTPGSFTPPWCYELGISTHGVAPSLRDIIFDPDPSNHCKHTESATTNITKTFNLGDNIPNVARVNVVVSGITGFPKLLMCDVKDKFSFEPGAFQMMRASATVSSSFINNVGKPSSSGEGTKSLEVGCFSPTEGRGANVDIVLTSTDAEKTAIVDFANAFQPQFFHDERAQDARLEGNLGKDALRVKLSKLVGATTSALELTDGGRCEVSNSTDPFQGSQRMMGFPDSQGAIIFAAQPSVRDFSGAVGTFTFVEGFTPPPGPVPMSLGVMSLSPLALGGSCAQDSDCVAPPASQVCHPDSPRVCTVTCTSDAQCSVPGATCQVASNTQRYCSTQLPPPPGPSPSPQPGPNNNFTANYNTLSSGTTYYVTCTAFGFKGSTTSLLYDGIAVSTFNPILRPSTAHMAGNLQVRLANATIALSRAHVNCRPDWRAWKGPNPCDVSRSTAAASISCAGLGYGDTESTTGYYSLTGLEKGNYECDLFTPFLDRPYNFNKSGTDGGEVSSCSGNAADDIRISMGGDDLLRVYTCAGALATGFTAGGNLDVTVTVDTSATGGVIGGRITFDRVVNLAASPVVVIAHEQFTGGASFQNFVPPKTGIAVCSADGASTCDYSMNVATGTKYFLEIKSGNYGVAWENRSEADLSQSTSSVGNNFKMFPSGSVKITVKLPDGTNAIPNNTPRSGQENNYWNGGCDCHGEEAHTAGFTEMDTQGQCNITGLLPGPLNCSIHGNGPGYKYTNASESGITVKVGQTTNVTLNLEEGEIVLPSISTAALVAAGVTFESGCDSVIMRAWPSGKEKGDEFIEAITNFSGGPDDVFSGGIVLSTSTGKPKFQAPRQAKKALDLYVVATRDILSEPDKDSGSFAPKLCDAFYSTIIGVRKNFEVGRSTEAQISFSPEGGGSFGPSATNASPVKIPLSLGNKVLAGSLVAASLLKAEDCSRVFEDFENLFNYIPFIACFDQDTKEFVGGGAAVPHFASVADIFAVEGMAHAKNCTGLRALFSGTGNTYKLAFLPAKKLTCAVDAENYVPMSFNVDMTVTASTVTRNINLDTEANTGGAISGVVKSTASVALEGCKVGAKSDLDDFSTETDASGNYTMDGLAAGTFEVKAKCSGYVATTQKVDVTVGQVATLNFSGSSNAMSLAGGCIRGSVYSQRFPSPKLFPGATVRAYDDTLNAQIAAGTAGDKELALITTKAGEDGTYQLCDIEVGHLFKMFVKEDGRTIDVKTATSAVTDVLGVDFELRSKPPIPELKGYKDATTGVFKVTIDIEKKTRSLPSVLVSSGTTFNISNASQVTVSSVAGVNQFTADISSTIASKPFCIKVNTDDGARKENRQKCIDPTKSERGNDADIESAFFGDVSVKADTTGTDNSGVKFPVGALTKTTGATSMSASVSLTDDALDSKAGTTGEKTYGDICSVTISSAQINTGRLVELKVSYDPTEVSASDIASGKGIISQYDSTDGSWDAVNCVGKVTLNQKESTLSCKVRSIAAASSLVSSAKALAADPKAGLALFSAGSGFVPSAHAAGHQEASFAVTPAATGGITASKYLGYNFPNPFNLKSKAVTLRTGTTGIGTTITGTYIVVAPTGSGTETVTLKIFNLAGDLVREITGTATRGQYNYFEWDGKNKKGSDVASGVYFCVVDASGVDKKKPIKMVVVK